MSVFLFAFLSLFVPFCHGLVLFQHPIFPFLSCERLEENLLFGGFGAPLCADCAAVFFVFASPGVQSLVGLFFIILSSSPHLFAGGDGGGGRARGAMRCV